MMQEKLEKARERFRALEQYLADPKIISDQAQYQKYAKEYSELTPLVSAFNEYKKIQEQTQALKHDLAEGQHDRDFIELAKSELDDLATKETEWHARLQDLLNPKVADKDRNLIFEIRAGTGGQEASLFAGDLFRMYTKYADKNGWKVELINSHPSEAGGFKEVIFGVSGKGAAKHLKWESGAHRVQRVPTTEASGRIHTSAATVAVLYEPEEVDIQIDPKDIKVDVFRSSGPGGQSVNTTDSAIRLTHLPTGIVVICQDERSQMKNKSKAMRVLKARLLDMKERENFEKTSQDRKLKVGTGDRSEKIRTYNYPDRRVTDHRIGFTTYKLPSVMDGDLDEISQALMEAEKKEALS